MLSLAIYCIDFSINIFHSVSTYVIGADCFGILGANTNMKGDGQYKGKMMINYIN